MRLRQQTRRQSRRVCVEHKKLVLGPAFIIFFSFRVTTERCDMKRSINRRMIRCLVIAALVVPFGPWEAQSQKMYWTDNAQPGGARIRRASADGNDIETVVVKPLRALRIALDVTSDKMYWTEDVVGRIQRANLDGSSITTLVTGLFSPRNIALDVTANKMYWSDLSFIQRANLDGSGIETLVTGGVAQKTSRWMSRPTRCTGHGQKTT